VRRLRFVLETVGKTEWPAAKTGRVYGVIEQADRKRWNEMRTSYDRSAIPRP